MSQIATPATRNILCLSGIDIFHHSPRPFVLVASLRGGSSAGLERSTLQGYAPPPEDAELSDSVEENIDQRGKSGAGGGVILGVFVVTFDPHVGAVDTGVR